MKMQDNRERFTLRIPRRLYATLTEYAERIGVSLNALISQILWEWMKKNTTDNTEEKRHDIGRDSAV